MEENWEYPLATQAKRKQVKFFNQCNHLPSEEQWLALEDILITIEDAANNKLEDNKIYLSSIDCGIGKTTSMIFMIRELLESDKHSDVSVMVMLSTKDQIRNLTKELHKQGVRKKYLGVHTSDEMFNRLGIDKPHHARVLITTQQMLESRAYNGSISNCPEFLYNNKVRDIRAWDESLKIGTSAAIDTIDLCGIVPVFNKLNKKLGYEMLSFTRDLQDKDHGEFIHIPDVEKEWGFNLEAALHKAKSYSDEVRRTLASFYIIAGREARVHKKGDREAVINYAETIPSDLFPIIVLDAGARVAGTYPLQQANKDNVLELQTATKTYCNAEILCWDQSSGKDISDSQKKVIANGIAKMINDEPYENYLIIQHDRMNYKEMIEPLLNVGVGTEFIHYCTWGKHTATNQYSLCNRIILTSVFYYDDAAYESMARLWSDTNIKQDIKDDIVHQLRRGEIKSNIMQACNRGIIRKSHHNNDCPECKLMIIGAKKKGAFNLLTDVFPKARQRYYDPFNPTDVQGLTPKGKAALGYIKARLDHGERLIKFSEIYKGLGMDANNFRKCVRMNSAFQEAVKELKISELNPNGNSRFTHFGYLSDKYFKAA